MNIQKKKTALLLGMAVVLFMSYFSFSNQSFAVGVEYTPLAPIDKYVEKRVIDDKSLTPYLNNMFKLGIALCTALAVLMIIIGGIQYVSSDAWSNKSEGKERMFAALTGLLIALGSWVLLTTISPRLVSTELSLEEVDMKGMDTPMPSTGPGTDRNLGASPIDLGATLPQADLNQYLLESIKNSNLPKLSPSDTSKYFPNGVTPEAWASLFSGIAEKESEFKPDLTYEEKFTDRNGNNVISTGLLQISQESARAYGFPNITTEQLKDPKTNLQVGVAIMQKWVARDGCISCKDSNGNWRGGARYWSALRR